MCMYVFVTPVGVSFSESEVEGEDMDGEGRI